MKVLDRKTILGIWQIQADEGKIKKQ